MKYVPPDRREYELTVVIRPGTDEEYEDVKQMVEKIITENGGQIVKFEDWGMKDLAYEVRKFDKAKYIYFEFKGNGPVINKQLERNLLTDERILRYLVVRKEKIETKGHEWRRKMQNMVEGKE